MELKVFHRIKEDKSEVNKYNVEIGVINKTQALT